MEYVPCIGNSSYSFWRILLKLYRCFKDGLKICILFFQNPEIIFYHFLRIFNLDIFRALILQICIWSMYLVSATPPTVFGESFWNFTDVLRMVCSGGASCMACSFIILAGNEDIHKISDEFEFQPDQTTAYGVSCPWASKKFPIDL